MGDKRVKYLEMLQTVISRMAENQFTLRKWSVGLGTAIIGYVASKDNHPRAAALAIFPAVVFWILDAYYLALEVKFRALFDAAKVIDDDRPNFSFGVTMDSGAWFRAGGRPAVWIVHLLVVLLAAGVSAYGWAK